MRRTFSALSTIGMLDSSYALLLPRHQSTNLLARRPMSSTHYMNTSKLIRLQQCQKLNNVRLFGAKVGSTTTPGDIYIEDAREDAVPSVDVKRLEATVSKIRDLIGYPTYDVSLYLIDDEDMKEANNESRSVDAPTDILSFPFLSAIEAGSLEDPPFDVPDYYNLGEMLVDVRYVMRVCEEDKEVAREILEDGVEYEDEDEEDRGVSKAMATVYDPEQRIHMLLVHGMLHLVGHDHEEDDEFEVMAQKEEELLEALKLNP